MRSQEKQSNWSHRDCPLAPPPTAPPPACITRRPTRALCARWRAPHDPPPALGPWLPAAMVA